MNATLPAVCSAIAAIFSALTAFMVMRIQRRNLLESIRPELTISGWSRQSDESGNDIIAFKKIRNSGRGMAFDVQTTMPTLRFGTTEERPYDFVRQNYHTSRLNLPIIAANETVDVDVQVTLNWNAVGEDESGNKFSIVHVNIFYSDSRNKKLVTIYSLYASSPSVIMGRDRSIAEGLLYLSRETRQSSFFKPLRRSVRRFNIEKSNRQKIFMMEKAKEAIVGTLKEMWQQSKAK